MTPEELVLEHRPVHNPYGHINGTVPGSVAVYDCNCGEVVDTTLEACAAHQVAALRTGGYELVKMPEPTQGGGTGEAEDPRASWTFGNWDRNLVEAWDDGTALHVKAPDFSWGRDVSIKEAREFAAALLAAAAVAEQTGAEQ